MQNSLVCSKSKAKTLEVDKSHTLRRSLWLVNGEQMGRNAGKSKETSASLRAWHIVDVQEMFIE